MRREVRSKVRNLIKSQRWLYRCYAAAVSALLKAWGTFLRTEEGLVLLVTYAGKRYDDSPKAVYQAMKADPRFRGLRFVWAFEDPDAVPEVPREEKVRIDTPAYFRTALQANYWITNSSASRGLDFRKKDTVNIFFPHGMSGIKKIGRDLPRDNVSFRPAKQEKFDIVVLEGREEEPIIRRAWDHTGECWLTGFPRNDDLLTRTPEEIRRLKQALGIPEGKKVILYAPTFREYQRDPSLRTYLAPPIDYDLWRQELGDEYVLLVTAHYEVEKFEELPEGEAFVIDAVGWPHINDLMVVSDLLITDYSSILFDYAILARPVLAYAYDFELYQSRRGLYPGYDGLFMDGVLTTERQVLDVIREMDVEKERAFTAEHIRDRFLARYGDAAEQFADRFYDRYLRK